MKKIGYVEYRGSLNFFGADFSYDILIRIEPDGYRWSRVSILASSDRNEWNLKLKQLGTVDFNCGFIMLASFQELKTINVE